ncbi:hypothetical protein AB1K84_03405 [Mesobacillus foraminis]|uniref:hypothetical protein n=1 Tax=Mesobacillus foraminis TaxID=279826 RepID=UPI0039A2946F
MTGIENFSTNEISLILLNLGGYLLMFLLPKKLNREVACLSILSGLATGMLFDFTIGGGVLDFYRQNDSNHYEVFDVVYYALFAPAGYFFMYFYSMLHINKRSFIFYITAWALLALALQWVFTLLDILTYQNNYKLIYSFPIFLTTQAIAGIFYEFITDGNQKKPA